MTSSSQGLAMHPAASRQRRCTIEAATPISPTAQPDPDHHPTLDSLASRTRLRREAECNRLFYCSPCGRGFGREARGVPSLFMRTWREGGGNLPLAPRVSLATSRTPARPTAASHDCSRPLFSRRKIATRTDERDCANQRTATERPFSPLPLGFSRAMGFGNQLHWAPLGWALLLLFFASCLTAQPGAFGENAGCEIHTNCSSCINITGKSQLNCTWIECNGNKSYCTNEAEEQTNCTAITPGNGTCPGSSINTSTIATPTTVTPAVTANASSSPTNTSSSSVKPTTTSVKPTTTPVNTTFETPATAPPKPSPHKSTFDAASFIGGIVLVLGLQAVIFFLYKFCKSKEQNYHTL
uniref:Sialomucin core protein 24 n=1 Tax=Salvator merianae TaxID=96440 RepID=A0A8D0CB70_SALMN